jgi:hypothetical protein
MTLFPDPDLPTATNNPSSVAHVTERQLLSAAETLDVQLIPIRRSHDSVPIPEFQPLPRTIPVPEPKLQNANSLFVAGI